MFTGSWKTKLFGIAGLLVSTWQLIGAPILDSDPLTNPQWPTFLATATTAIGVIFARDNNKTSEDIGIK